MREVDFSELLGKTITEIKGMENGNYDISFSCSDGTEYTMYHEQDCCETVSIEDVAGCVEDLIGSTITLAEEVTNVDAPPASGYADSYTWTYYKLATTKGYVTIRWYGESNGYYSEGVSFKRFGN